jgi:hypothetical protein
VREHAALKNRFREAESSARRPCVQRSRLESHARWNYRNCSNIILRAGQLSRHGRDAFHCVRRHRAQFLAARNICGGFLFRRRRMHRASVRFRIRAHCRAAQAKGAVIGQKNPGRDREKHGRPSPRHRQRASAQHVFASPMRHRCSIDFFYRRAKAAARQINARPLAPEAPPPRARRRPAGGEFASPAPLRQKAEIPRDTRAHPGSSIPGSDR